MTPILDPQPMTAGRAAALACVWEATAAKPGNVYRGADFADVTYVDFVSSAVAIAPVFERAHEHRLGTLVLEAIRATRAVVATNTNLGMVLLFAPLALVPAGRPLKQGIGEVLGSLTADDCRDVYEAIRLASAGGLGKVEQADVHGEAPRDLIAAMHLAAERDLIARQYAHQFADVFESAAAFLAEGIEKHWPLENAIIHAHLRMMAAYPDSLIGRKCGAEVARESAARAGRALECGSPGDADYADALADLDFWLRADGHRRNPGTTADLIAAGLFTLLRDGIIQLPVRFYA